MFTPEIGLCYQPVFANVYTSLEIMINVLHDIKIIHIHIHHEPQENVHN